jgi:magnesium transporter
MVKTARSTPSLLEDEWPALSTAERAARFAELPPDKAEGLYRSLTAGNQVDLLLRLSADQRRLWMRTLDPDDAADCLQAAPAPARDELLGYLDPRTRSEIVALLAYADDEAGGLMNPRYVAVRPEMRVDDALAYLRRQALQRVGTVYCAYVLDPGKRLRGVVSVRELFAAVADKTVAEVMTTDVVHVSEGTDQEEVGRLLAQHDLVAIPVVDAEERIVGIVSVDDILDVVSEEATEDIQRLGGQRPLPDAYLRTSLPRMIWRRGGWLAALFLGEMLTTSAMGRYQDDIARSVTLALFVPLIISSGGNSGSQATTLVIRAMSLGELKLRHWRRVLSRELVAGTSLGLVLGAIGLSRIAAWQVLFGSYGEHALRLAAVVGISLVGVVVWGAVSGAMLPFGLRAAGMDPASASAPLVATVVDVTGIVIYFSVARAILAV